MSLSTLYIYILTSLTLRRSFTITDASPGIVSKGARDDSMEMEELSGERAAFIKGTKSANEADDTPLGVEIHPRKAVQEHRTPAEVYGEVDCIETRYCHVV